MNARIGRPPKGLSRGEDSIFVATHLSGLKVRSVVVFKSPPAPARKDPALRGSGKKGTNAWNIFLSEKMDVCTPSRTQLLSIRLISSHHAAGSRSEPPGPEEARFA